MGHITVTLYMDVKLFQNEIYTISCTAYYIKIESSLNFYDQKSTLPDFIVHGTI